MWTFFEDGTFYSAVADRSDSDQMWVRARDRRSADLISEETGAKVLENMGTDYAFRVKISREAWRDFVVNKVETARATNFKAEVGKNLQRGKAKKFLDSLHDVWGVMYDYQQDLLGKKTHWG